VFYVILGKTERDLVTHRWRTTGGSEVVEQEVIGYSPARDRTDDGRGPMPYRHRPDLGIGNLDTMDILVPLQPSGPPDRPRRADDSRNTIFFTAAKSRCSWARQGNANLSTKIGFRNQQAAAESRSYIFVGAFDLQELMKKKKKLLWRTRMSVSRRITPCRKRSR